MRTNIKSSLPEITSVEKSVLGSCLVSSIAVDTVLDRLSFDDFYSSNHAEIFKIIKEMAENGRAIDLITVSDVIKTRDKTELTDSVLDLMEYVVSDESIDYYCTLIIEKSIARKLIRASNNIDRMCRESENVEDLIEYSEAEIASAVDRKSDVKILNSNDMMIDTVSEVDRMRSGGRVGITTGFKKLDECIGGLDRGDFAVLGGRPSMGKTALMLAMIINQAVVNNIPVFIFSIEMPKKALGQRLISIESGIPLFNIRFGHLNQDQYILFSESAARISKAPIHIDDTGSLNSNKFKSVLRRAQRKYGVQICYVDHLHLMDYKGEDPVHGTTKNSRALKIGARDLNIPVCALAQLSRLKNPDIKKIIKPSLSDLRQSGAIEQDADIVTFIHRDFYYSKKEEDKFDADLIVAKQRNGAISDLKIMWDGKHTRFYESGEQQQQEW